MSVAVIEIRLLMLAGHLKKSRRVPVKNDNSAGISARCTPRARARKFQSADLARSRLFYCFEAQGRLSTLTNHVSHHCEALSGSSFAGCKVKPAKPAFEPPWPAKNPGSLPASPHPLGDQPAAQGPSGASALKGNGSMASIKATRSCTSLLPAPDTIDRRPGVDAGTPAEVAKGSWCEIAAAAAVAMPSRAPRRLCPLASSKSVPPMPIPGGRLLASEQGTRVIELDPELGADDTPSGNHVLDSPALLPTPTTCDAGSASDVCEHDSLADGQATRRAHEPTVASSGNEDATRVLMDSAEAALLEGASRAAG